MMSSDLATSKYFGCRCGIAVSFALFSVAANADVLIGANGERLVGHIVKEKNGVITFQSDLLGRIKVPADKFSIVRENVNVVPATISQASEQQEPASSASEAAPRVDKNAGHWNAEVSGKFSNDRGSLLTPEDRVDATFKVNRIAEIHELYTTLNYNYKYKDGKLTDNNWLFSVSDDFFLSNNRFVSAKLLASQELKDNYYNHTYTGSVAYGWRFWERPDRFVRVGPAVGYLYLERESGSSKGPAYGLYARALWPLFKQTKFSTELLALDSLQDGRYLNVEMRLRRPVTEHFFVGLAWNYAWSESILESGISSKWRWDFGWQFDQEPK